MTYRCCLTAGTVTKLSLLLLLVSLLGACAPVQPWERGHLAQANMALAADPLRDAMDEHVYNSKEASSGGMGAAGGGCGCN
ncbi:MAG: DUF4266 domain-containing protein [Xanthomonadales bacterium]|nr:DUF4266 domain-containing protein [Xanthomonadales bacterium]